MHQEESTTHCTSTVWKWVQGSSPMPSGHWGTNGQPADICASLHHMTTQSATHPSPNQSFLDDVWQLLSFCHIPADLFLQVASRSKCVISERQLTCSGMAYKGSLSLTVSVTPCFVGPWFGQFCENKLPLCSFIIICCVSLCLTIKPVHDNMGSFMVLRPCVHVTFVDLSPDGKSLNEKEHKPWICFRTDPKRVLKFVCAWL